ncbi:MAG: hypothetical protein ACFFDU_08220 [Candidatus Thorarchaeota archaeon]
MGLWQRIKEWIRREPKPITTNHSHTQHERPTYPEEVEILLQEHDQLGAERTRLRGEIKLVDTQYAQGKIEAGERDRAYRARLARAGQIGLRQIEIRNQLAKMGYPIPKEQRTSNIVT